MGTLIISGGSGTGTLTFQAPSTNEDVNWELPSSSTSLSNIDYLLYSSSSTTHNLDLSSGRDFAAFQNSNYYQLSSNTTLTFSNIPTVAMWNYTAWVNPISAGDVSSLANAPDSTLTGAAGSRWAGSQVMKDDGTILIVLDSDRDRLYRYDLSTPYDLSTATLTTISYMTESIPLSGITDAQGVRISSDGTKLFVLYKSTFNQTNCFTFNLATPWDITDTSSLTLDSTNQTYFSDSTYPCALEFNPNGTKVFVGYLGNDTIHQYTLSTPWDLSTRSSSQGSITVTNLLGLAFPPKDVSWHNTASRVAILITTGEIIEYSSTDYLGNYDITTFTTPSGTYENSTYMNFNEFGGDIFITPSGSHVLTSEGASDKVHAYSGYVLPTLSLPTLENPPTKPLEGRKSVYYKFYTNDGGTTIKLLSEEIA
jgi:hypothetical protein